MANQEYDMLFKLSAQLDKAFGTTFGSAQKTMTEMQNEVKALSQAQADISAYQKQQNAVDATSRKLEDYQAELQNIKREQAESGEYSSKLANAEIEMQRKIDTTSEKLEKQTAKLDELQIGLENAGIDTNNLTEESRKLDAQIDVLASEMKHGNDSVEQYEQSGVSAFSAVGEALVAAGIINGLKEIYQAYMDCVNGASKYADQVLTDSIIYGISADELQAYAYASELVDVSVDTMTSTMTKNIKSMYSARDGSENVSEAYKKLGIEITNADDSLRDGETVYWEVIDALGAIENKTERDGIAMTILGKSAREVNTLIKAGSETMNQYAEEAEDVGYILSNDVLNTLGALDDQEQLQKNNITALKNALGAVLAPEITHIKEIENELLVGVTEFVAKHPAVVKGIMAVGAELGIFAGTYAIYTTYKKIDATLTPILTALKKKETEATAEANAALMLNPYIAVAAGVAALTVGIVALVNAEDEEAKELRTLTEASREQHEEIEKLKSDYEEAANAQGENSEQALYLAWQIDELTDSYEANKQTMDEYIAAHDDLINGINDEVNAARDSVEAAEMNGTKTLALIHRLEELASQTDKTVGSQEEMKAIIAALNKEVPDLALNYEDVVNGVVDFGENLEAFVKAKADAEKYAAAQEAIVEAYNARTEAEAQLTADQDELVAAQNRLAQATDTYMSMYGNVEGLGAVFALLTPEYKEMKAAQEAVDDLTGAINADEDAIANANDTYNKSAETIASYSEAIYGATESERSMTEAISETKDEIDKLTTGYIEAYNAAYESITGQYAIWDEAAKVSTTSVSTINKNLEDQATYWENYNTNLQSLQDRTADIEGLSEVIASFADGSSDSVNAIAGMAKASDDDLKKMVENWKLLQEQELSASDSLADLATDFSNTMDTLQTQLKEDIEAMNLTKEAKESGLATIQGFIDGAVDMISTVKAKYRELGKAAAEALRAEIEETTITAQVNVVGGVDNAYASGTDYAASGYALVGEEGPELVKFNGGEKVYPAAETAAMLDRNAVSVNISPNITINGNATEETATVIVDEIISQVKMALEESGIDARRGAYV